MIEMVDIEEARTVLPQLVDRAANGDEVIILRAGRPVARLIAFGSRSVVRTPGRMRGRVRIGRDFDAPLANEL